jgi:SulP family sulfate permease
MPRGETTVMIATVAVVLATHNLAIGVIVIVGVVVARQVAHMVDVTSVLDPDGGSRVYAVRGEVFFAAIDAITTKYAARGKEVRIVGLNDASTSKHRRLSGQFGVTH